jgi:hypothetical protein
MLLVALAVVVASFVLQVNDDGDRVALRNVPGAKVPPLCMTRTFLGISCPGCGLTRSFIYLAHGDPEASWKAHRVGWLVAALVLAQVPYRLHELYRPRKRGWAALLSRWFPLVLFVLLIGNWLLGLLLPLFT